MNISTGNAKVTRLEAARDKLAMFLVKGNAFDVERNLWSVRERAQLIDWMIEDITMEVDRLQAQYQLRVAMTARANDAADSVVGYH